MRSSSPSLIARSARPNKTPIRPNVASSVAGTTRRELLGVLSVARSGYDGVSSTIARSRAGSRPLACASTRWLW